MIEGNDVASKFKIAGGGSPKKVPVVAKSLFKFFKFFLGKSAYEDIPG